MSLGSSLSFKYVWLNNKGKICFYNFAKILSSFLISRLELVDEFTKIFPRAFGPFIDCVSKENNAYVGLTTTTLSRRLTMHLNDSSSIALHLETYSIPKSKFRKLLVENPTIIVLEINKLRLQIPEALHKKKKKLKSIELILKIATMFWNAFFFVFFLNIPYYLIIFKYRW